MSYDVKRTSAIRDAYAATVKRFLETYKRGLPTVVLLPGGMGSQLDRSPAPAGGAPSSLADYNPVWLDPGILFEGDALRLEIDHHSRDLGGHIIVPNGPLRFLINAYDGTERFFTRRHHEFNYVVFGYDWRRSLEESAGFLEYFLKLLRDRIFQRHRDPRPRITLFCHSQGGLVATVFLHRNQDPDAFDNVITVGTSFYGTCSQQARYYVGMQPLSTLHGKGRVARIIGTLPGLYAVMLIDRQTFDRDHERLGLNRDDYPIVDQDDGSPADPYDRRNLDRYPPWLNAEHLERARRIRAVIAAPLPEAVARRVFNLRSCLDSATPTRQAWGRLPAGFDPDQGDRAPVHTRDTFGGGDGTVPGWAAWHAYVPAENRIDLTQADDHTFLAEHEEVLTIARQIIKTGHAPALERVRSRDRLLGPRAAPAPQTEVKHLLEDAREGRLSRDDPRINSESIWRGLMQALKR